MTALAAARISGHDSQQVFDSLLWALAEPGTIRTLPTEVLHRDIPTPCWLPLALADVGIAVSVDDDPEHPLAQLVTDATGARPTTLGDAWLAVMTKPDPDRIAALDRGDALAPENGARLAIAVDALDPSGRSGCHLVLAGPGIEGHRNIGVVGLTDHVAAMLGIASGDFPAGIDTWLFTPSGDVAAISRSTSVVVRTTDETGS